MLDIQHATLKNMAQLVTLCMSIGTKGGLALKGHNLMDCNGLPQ